MAKVTSAACKADIIDTVYPESKASDWKRRKKYTDGDEIIRLFENDVIGKAVEVIEQNGEITGSRDAETPAKKPDVEFLYAISPEESEDDPGSYEVCFGTVSDWKSRGCQTDVGIDEVSELLSKLGIYEDAENFYLIEADKLELVKEMLEEDPRIGMSPGFSKFIEGCD